MTSFEKGAAVIGALITIIVFAFTIGGAWNSLNNRIDGVDKKIVDIQKTLGSTACTSILTRQIEAIEKDRPAARRALEELSQQYKCAPTADVAFSADALVADTENAALAVELNAVDAILNEGN